MEILKFVFYGFFGIFIGIIVGVPMGIVYINPIIDKIIYLALAVSCILIFILGIYLRKRIVGKILITVSLLLWASLSAVGFSMLGA